MTWNETLPLLVTVLVALIGWLVVHWLNTCRDQANKRRELRVQHLLASYLDLLDAAWHQKLRKQEETVKLIADACARIQLFGNETQITMAAQCIKDYADGTAPVLPLLNNLRSDLRRELKLPQTNQELQWFSASRKQDK